MSDVDLTKGLALYEASKFTDAIPFLKLAADNGNSIASEKLANCYKKTDQIEKAIPYWEFCMNQGNHASNTNYAAYLKTQPGQEKLAYQLWRDASEAGVAPAAFNLGVWLKQNGMIEEAIPYLNRSGELGYMDGFYVLAGVYLKSEQWELMLKALSPLVALRDKRALDMIDLMRTLRSSSQSLETETDPITEVEDDDKGSFTYRKEDTDDPSFIGIFCGECDNEIGYGKCPDCEGD